MAFIKKHYKMDMLLEKAAELEKDELEDYGKIQPIYDSSLTDVIIMMWEELEAPWEWILSDQTIQKAFEKSFAINKIDIKAITLYRGTDYLDYYSMKEGEILDYTNRYTSWTTDPGVSSNFADPEKLIFLVYNGSIVAFELKSNRCEQEFIVGPCKFTVDKVLSVPTADGREEQGKMINEAITGNIRGGDGRIFILKELNK